MPKQSDNVIHCIIWVVGGVIVCHSFCSIHQRTKECQTKNLDKKSRINDYKKVSTKFCPLTNYNENTRNFFCIIRSSKLFWLNTFFLKFECLDIENENSRFIDFNFVIIVLLPHYISEMYLKETYIYKILFWYSMVWGYNTLFAICR